MNDMQEYINKKIDEARAGTFEKSPQLTLGEIIEKIEEAGVKNGDKDKLVYYDFGDMGPTCLESWRGAYSELALGYSDSQIKANKLLEELKSAIGKEYEGWKGGDFTMSKDTPVWVANEGYSGNTGITDIVNDGWRLIIMTAYCEY